MNAAEVDAITADLRAAREGGKHWLLDRIAPDGRPHCCAEPLAWSRLPWALSGCGEVARSAAVLDWVGRTIASGSDPLRIERAGPAMLAYPLAHVAIGATLGERYDLGRAMLRRLDTFRHPETGGIDTKLVGLRRKTVQDLLLTAQAGIAALIAGDDAAIDLSYAWIERLYAQQPGLPHRLFTMREGESLVTDPPEGLAWLGLIDFRLPRQSYYSPGIAAAFLGGMAMRRDDERPRDLGRAFLALNASGTASQFEDPDSVQICKFGWGAATMLLADPDGGHLAHVARMARWFIDRQDRDGGWSPSRFMASCPREDERMMKTAEHVVECSAILAALGAAGGRMGRS